MSQPKIVQAIEEHAISLETSLDLESLIEKLSQAQVVMLGEASHGTQEFYEWRRLISQELISRHGFQFIAVEGDWPACAEINKYIHSPGDGTADKARAALKHFQRWPTWMWANTEVVKLVQWLKAYNEGVDRQLQAGFFGLDVYSLFESIDQVLKEMRGVDAKFANELRRHYECFDQFQRNEKAYARSLVDFPQGCEDEVLTALRDLLKYRLSHMAKSDALFDAQQNARIIKNAEDYYRTMIHGDEDSWNVRDRHMMETLETLRRRYGGHGKAIVWAHNTHIGDYKATNMLEQGQVNIGGLAREKWGEQTVALVGFGTYQGEVIASGAWDGIAEEMIVPEARENSYEEAFHQVSESIHHLSFYLWLRGNEELEATWGHRAIGVVYHPEYEHFGNYVPTSLSKRYDAFIFIDRTTALVPLIQRFIREEIPETWPQGI